MSDTTEETIDISTGYGQERLEFSLERWIMGKPVEGILILKDGITVILSDDCSLKFTRHGDNVMMTVGHPQATESTEVVQ